MTDTTNDLALGELQATEPNVANGGLPAGLPMPRDPALLFDLERRYRPSTFGPDRYPFPIPNGWFVVAEAGEIGPGEVRALRAFDRDLVLFRAADGTAHVMDAHCPHLGAHLAVGGRVEEGCLRCPFHGWKFDGESGKCVDIPYGDVKRIPPKAHARAYPTLERNHMIWAWYHAQEGEPFYEVPEVPEFHDPDWSPVIVRTFEIRVSAQDMAENNVDFSHFRFVHGSDGIPEDEFITEGTYKKTIGGGGTFIREGFGLGLGVLRVQGYVTFLSSTTPLDTGNVLVRWVFTSPRSLGEGASEQAAESFCAGVSQDIPIWENKVYRDPPVITKTEKLILEHRRWCEQFYS
jgi:nitrite reductase/ring-hydroxylating ferredoxin subunit